MRKIQVVLLVAFMSLFRQEVLAQPFTLSETIKPKQLELVDYRKDDPKKKGRINVTEVNQESDTLYYFVKDLSIYSPIYFSVTSDDPSAPLKVQLSKNSWGDVNRKGETDGKGKWEAKFKTEGDFGIMIVAGVKPAKYTLLTWVGNEAKEIGMGSPFKGDTKKNTGTGGGNNSLPWIITGVVVLLALVLLVIKKKKQKIS